MVSSFLTKVHPTYFYTSITTPLGSMVAVADDVRVLCLQFASEWAVSQDVLAACNASKDISLPLQMLKEELTAYFQGTLRHFTTPFYIGGTPFQQKVLHAVAGIAHGHTQSYKAIAQHIGIPQACRAVGNANGANPLVILVGCHRIVQTNGSLGGYSAGIQRKRWLLAHEGNRV